MGKPPYKVSWLERLNLKEGDIWEERYCEMGIWEEVITRWTWDGAKWVQDHDAVDIP